MAGSPERSTGEQIGETARNVGIGAVVVAGAEAALNIAVIPIAPLAGVGIALAASGEIFRRTQQESH